MRVWCGEAEKWSERAKMSYFYYHVKAEQPLKKRIATLREWARDGGVAVIGYEALLALVKGKAREQAVPLLQQPGPDLIVLDEGHRIKNMQSKQHAALAAVRTRRRVILTGTPLQNNLNEYHAMVDFVRPALLGTVPEFRNRFVAPITNGNTLVLRGAGS
ncbi:hypothetical protein EMIHUDRAFT_238958 [Emiliania huxleyi CCMP1516]|uniref:Helicase ATP-binding domain-containing protein n=2 Tax=Emiliania huxleyi TaxID=2903 RepID=A0A0D3JKU4_EMIH1|nr:hypothetical protein EMIHUDRAFT_238958 [Emiliania huxleyi CCMP1516]EOD24129.1 hypothetical protein EMIHUDRAFT_238958 [Emiliania huxleyi CCMP1516]|eukprot:XP_005776558.1 hypothetical protein EMIHUDRAFT_238958 [Emiliania huxleyi CCMP1516]